MGRNIIERQFHSTVGLGERLYDPRADLSEFSILAMDWDAFLPIRRWLTGLFASFDDRKSRGGRPREVTADQLFALILVEARFGFTESSAYHIVRARPELRSLYGFYPKRDHTGNPFPARSTVGRFIRHWERKLAGDLTAIRRFAYIDIPAASLAKWRLPLDRAGLDCRVCLSPQRRPDRYISRARLDEGSGKVWVRHQDTGWPDRGRLKASALAGDTGYILASRCLHHIDETDRDDAPDEGVIYRQVLLPELRANCLALRKAVVALGCPDPGLNRVMIVAGDNHLNTIETLDLLRNYGWRGAFRPPERRALVGKVRLRNLRPRRGDPDFETREASDDGAWFCPCTAGIELNKRPPMTRRIPDRGELTITCERDCRHSGKIFRVPPAPEVLGRGERERASDPRLSSQLAPYLPRVNAVNHRLKNSLERHNGAVTREHALGQKHRDQAARWLYGQFAHDLHYSMVDALMNLDISRNLDRLGGPGPLVPWNVAEDRAMENNYGVIHRKNKRKKEEQRENAAVSTGWRPSSSTDKDEERLKELEKERVVRATPATSYPTEWLSTQSGRRYVPHAQANAGLVLPAGLGERKPTPHIAEVLPIPRGRATSRVSATVSVSTSFEHRITVRPGTHRGPWLERGRCSPCVTPTRAVSAEVGTASRIDGERD